MISVLCPVCGKPLETGPRAWRCPDGHSFDVARQGYVNLLPVTQKHSRHPGDTRGQVAARRAFLDAGYYAPIAAAVCRLLEPEKLETALDAGCGEGYYLTRLMERMPLREAWGVDISKDAVRFASAKNKKARWLAATAAHLPFPDGSFDAVLSMFALTAAEEFHRVLRPGGVFLQVLAGEEHLLGLKRLIYPELLRREKDLSPALPGFRLERSETLEFSFRLEGGEQVANLLAMTPHFWRISAEGAAAAAAADSLEDGAQVVLNLYRAEETI